MRATPALQAVGTKVNHLGPVGAGATWKLINNFMGAAQLAVLSEGLALAAAAGVDPAQAATLIGASLTASPMVIAKLPRMSGHSYAAPDFMLKLMVKDVTYASALAETLGVKAEVMPAVAALFHRAADKGLGDLDTAAVREVFAK